MAPAFKRLLRHFLDQASSSAAYAYANDEVYDQEDDEEDEMVQQRLRIPGSPSHRQVQSGVGWIRGPSSDDERRSQLHTTPSVTCTERTSADTERSAATPAPAVHGHTHRSCFDAPAADPAACACTSRGDGLSTAYASQFFAPISLANRAVSAERPLQLPPAHIHAADESRAYSSGVECHAAVAGTSCRRRSSSSAKGLQCFYATH